MNKKIIGLAAVLGFFAVTLAFFHPGGAQAQTSAPSADGQFSCFDLFRFGSVKVNLSGMSSVISAGSEVSLKAHISNENAYPIVDGSVYVKVFRQQSVNASAMANGENVVDELLVLKNINLPAKGSVDRTFAWKIPAYAISGKYQVVSYFLVGGKANLMGLPFTDDVHGAPFNFTVTGQTAGVYLDKNSVKVDGKAFNFVGFPKPLNSTKPIIVQATVVNTTKDVITVPVIARVYRWSQTDADGKRSDMSQQVTLAGGEKKTVSFTVNDQESSTVVAIEADYKDTKSIMEVRFIRDGLAYPRINNIALVSNGAGKGLTMFACAHAAGSSAAAGSYDGSHSQPVFGVQGSKIVLTLSDAATGSVIDTYTYTGNVTGDMMGFRKNVSFKSLPDKLILRGDAYQGSLKLDSITVHYDCSILGMNGCSKSDASSSGRSSSGVDMAPDSDTMVWIILGLLVALIILSVAAHTIRKKQSASRGMRMLILGLAGFGAALALGLSPHTAHAESVTWSHDSTGGTQYAQAWVQDVNMEGCGVPHTPPCMGITVSSVHVDVTYNAVVTRGGVQIPSGTSLTPGDVITFTTPITGTDINYLETGSGYGTPYGTWDIPHFCAAQDYRQTSIADFFTPLVVGRPSTSLSISGPVSGSGWGPYTVTGAGTVSATVNFNATNGRMDAQSGNHPVVGGCKTWAVAYAFAVPAQGIGYSFPVVVPNNPPATPVIGGPANVLAGVSNGYTVVSSDPENDNITYNIDYDANHSSVDQVVGPGGSNVTQNFNKSFPSAGTYTIYAQAVDTSGAGSGWATYSVTVTNTYTLTVQILGSGTGTVTSSPAGINCSSGTCSASFTAGTVVTLNGAAGGSSTFTAWGNNCSSFTAPAACTVTMSADRNATAQFNAAVPSRTMSVTVLGNGSVSSSPAGISCSTGTCNASYSNGTVVTLTPTPGVGATFTGWSGACGGVGACVVTMSSDRAVTANFTYTLTVQVTGGGSGSIDSSPAGISCAGGTCSANFNGGTVVTLTGTAGGSSTFTAWGGSCSPFSPPGDCTVTMSSDRSVTAAFGTVCSDGMDNDGDGLIDYPSDAGCSGGGGTTETGGGPLTSVVCTPSGVTTLSNAGSVIFSASATALGVGSGTYQYSWDGGATWASTNNKSVSYSIPGGPGPSLRARDAVGPGAALPATTACGNVVVTGSITTSVGVTPAAAAAATAGNTIAITPGSSFVVKWNRNLVASYTCSPSITPSSGNPASWSQWMGGDFSSSGITGNMTTLSSTPAGLYSFNLTCVDGAATPGPTYTAKSMVRITLTTENEI